MRAGSAEGTSQYLFSRVRVEIISRNPDTQLKWNEAVKLEDKGREALQKSGGSISRLTGGFDASPESGVAPEDINYVRPDAGVPAEGDLNSIMAQRDKLLREADIKIRDALIARSLTPLAIEDAQIYEIVEHDWRREIVPAESEDWHIHPGRIYFKNRRWPVYFDRAEADRFIAELLDLPTFEKLPSKQQAVVRFFRTHCPTRNYGKFGTNTQLTGAILAEYPALKTLDGNTLRKAKAFFEAELRAAASSR